MFKKNISDVKLTVDETQLQEENKKIIKRKDDSLTVNCIATGAKERLIHY